MERKILFKAKKLSDGKWAEGYFYKECDNTYIIEDRQKDSMLNRNEAFLVDPSTVCQFTGLKNKDGKPIWEHDIICNPFLDDKGQEVIFNNGVFMIDGIPISEEILFEENVVHLQNLGSKFDRKEGEK